MNNPGTPTVSYAAWQRAAEAGHLDENWSFYKTEHLHHRDGVHGAVTGRAGRLHADQVDIANESDQVT